MATRFLELVKTSGKPEIVSLWTDPKSNPQFMKAVKQNRVLTVIQEPRSKRTDFAEIGFHRVPYASYLIFPKPLPAERDGRVIGIKYELVEMPVPNDPVSAQDLETGVAGRKRRSKPARSQPEPATKTFQVLVRRVAVSEDNISVTAQDEDEAKERASAQVKRERFDLTKAVVRNEILRVE
jgi:hypothetical protein